MAYHIQTRTKRNIKGKRFENSSREFTEFLLRTEHEAERKSSNLTSLCFVKCRKMQEETT